MPPWFADSPDQSEAVIAPASLVCAVLALLGLLVLMEHTTSCTVSIADYEVQNIFPANVLELHCQLAHVARCFNRQYSSWNALVTESIRLRSMKC